MNKQEYYLESETLPIIEATKIQETLKPFGYDVIGFKKEKPHELVLYLDCTRRFKSYVVKDLSTLVDHE
jgi:hypothetical protein